MLKLVPPDANKLDNFKCGEIFCEPPTKYNVCCCLCGKKQPLLEFPAHFQSEHLAEEYVDNVKSNSFGGQSDEKPPSLPQNIEETAIKCEDDEDKPISALFPMDVFLEDEKPIDIFKVQFCGRTKKNKDIIVENFSFQSFQSNSDDAASTHSTHINKLDDAIQDKDNINDEAAAGVFNDSHSDSSDDESKGGATADDLNFACTECPYTFRTQRGLKNHVRFKHKNIHKPKQKKGQKFKCNECGEIFPSQRNLNGHMYKHTGIICDICGKSFSQTGNMRRHKIRHTGIKAHKCDECGNCFYTDKELKAHMMRHTGILPIICEVCGRRCRDHGVLTAHMRRHTGERPAKCPVCGKCFYSVYDLNVHSVTHSTLRPFKCDVCGSTFQTKKALRVHKKLHSTDRKHECKICGKTFVQTNGLVAHMRTHNTAEDAQANMYVSNTI